LIPTDVTPPEDHEPHAYSLSVEQVEHLAEMLAPKVAEIIKKDLFAGIGETVVKKAMYLVGIAVFALAAWLGAKGLLK
jgi:hypothetical protein